MKKVALLIGVSDYLPGLTPLPSTVKDVEAMQQVLANPLMGEFDEVRPLLNPDRQEMESEIETLFSGCDKTDLALLYFTGHGIKDDRGDLYFATRKTHKSPKGELVKSTAVAADFVHKIMSGSHSKRQVIILDCCFSGAFATGMTAKDSGIIDIQAQLGGEGRAVLTSSTSSQYSFEQEGSELSLYTRYIVQGIETGAADLDNDGIVAVDELHDYAKAKVQETVPVMKPEIYSVKEGFRIFLAHASPSDPLLHYRREVQRFANRGEISNIARIALEAVRRNLNLTAETATHIEEEVLEPSREHQKHLRQYEQTFFESVWREYPLLQSTMNDLRDLQRILGLREEDIRPIEARVLSRKASMQQAGGNPDLPPAGLTSEIKPLGVPLSPPQSPPTRARVGKLLAKSTTASSAEAKSRPRKSSNHSPWAIALFTVVLGLILGSGGYGYFRWQMTRAGEQTLTEAAQQLEAGNIDEAIANLSTLTLDNPLYAEAQTKIQEWRAAWEADKALMDELQGLLDNYDDISGAEGLSTQLVTTYWQQKAAQSLTTARVRVGDNLQYQTELAQVAQRQAEAEADAARQQAIQEAQRRRAAEEAALRQPLPAGTTYRVIQIDLNVRSRPSNGVIGAAFTRLPLNTLVRVTGALETARLPEQSNEEVVWVEINDPVSGWVSRRMIEGPIAAPAPSPGTTYGTSSPPNSSP